MISNFFLDIIRRFKLPFKLSPYKTDLQFKKLMYPGWDTIILLLLTKFMLYNKEKSIFSPNNRMFDLNL